MSISYDNTEQIKELIKRRRFQILVHSYIYFRLNNSIISNSTFDTWSRELIQLQEIYPELSAEVELYDEFKAFISPSCASSLPLDDTVLAHKAKLLVNMDSSIQHELS